MVYSVVILNLRTIPRNRYMRSLVSALAAFTLISQQAQAMNGIAFFYLWPKDKFEVYSKMAVLVPPDQTKLAKAQAQGAQLILKMESISGAELESPAYRKKHQKEFERYETLESYRKKNAREPYELKWAGVVMWDLMTYLKEAKHIDLGTVPLADYDGDGAYFLMDKAFKDKYLTQLDPAKFSAGEMKHWHDHYTEQRQDEELKAMESKHFEDKQMQQTVAKYIKNMKEDRASKRDDFPEQGKAMMDAVRILHNCLKLVDDKSVLVLELVP